MQTIEVYTDGGCHGNPGPGGWAFVVVGENGNVERFGAEPETTNNRMELTAVIEALQFCSAHFASSVGVRLHTDSQYVRNGITDWIERWRLNGWRTAAKKAVKNQDLWRRLDELNTALSPAWSWVRGHAGDPLNERCDELVQQAIATLRPGRST